MKFYLTIIYLIIGIIGGIAQDRLDESHVDFLRKQGLPECIQLKYSKKYTNVINLPTKSIIQGHPETLESVASESETDRFAYIMLLDDKQYLYYGDSLFSTCIITLEADSNGIINISTRGDENYTTDMLFHELMEICNKQIITLRQAKRVARSFWNEYRFHPGESILKYDIKHGKLFWILTGHKLLNERIILIDAQSGDYEDTWDQRFD